MIYKMEGQFVEDNLSEIIEKLKDYFNFRYSNGTLYCAIKDYQKREDGKKKIKEDFYLVFQAKNICEMTIENMAFENCDAVEWIKAHFIRLDEQRFEYENQQKLLQCKKFLDELEKNLSN